MRIDAQAVAAGVLTLAAVLTWSGLPGSWLLRVRVRRPARPSQRPYGVRGALVDHVVRKPSAVEMSLLALAGVSPGAVGFSAGPGPAVGALRGILAAGLVCAAWNALARRTRERHARLRRDAWQEACESMASHLRAGRSAEQALAAAATCCPDLEPVARGQVLGADVPAALRAVPDCEPARSLAAAWQTAESSGAALGPVVERVLGEIDAARDLSHEVDAQLAGPLTTTRVLAVLPVGGIGLGYLLGVDVPHLLLSTPLGLGCVCVAAALSSAGLLWVHRLADAVRPR